LTVPANISFGFQPTLTLVTPQKDLVPVHTKNDEKPTQTTKDFGQCEVTFEAEMPGRLSVRVGAGTNKSHCRYTFDLDAIRIDLHGANGPMMRGPAGNDPRKALQVGPLGLTHLKQLRELGVWMERISAH
jgi:hypothetical protein